jgi:hypothetical protein
MGRIMKLFCKLLKFWPILIQTTIYAQDICGSKAIGAKTEAEAGQRAAVSLSQAINSKVSYNSKMEETIDGMESSQKDTTTANINSKLLNAQAAKYTKGKDAEGHFSTACMSVKDAAKPYLDSLKYLATVLKSASQKISKENCQNANATYKSIKEIENVLLPLKQMDSTLQKGYESNYAKYEKECGSSAKGVYVESNNVSFSGKISPFIVSEGCVLAENADNSAITLKISAAECEQRNDNIMETAYCSSCVEIDLQNNKTGKSLYKDNFTGPKVGWTDMENACKKALEKTVSEAWEKIKGKINIGECK